MSETRRASASETGRFRPGAAPRTSIPARPLRASSGTSMPSCASGEVSRSWPSESSQRVFGPAGPVGFGREGAQAPALGEGEALEALEAAVPQKQGRVARPERLGQVLRSAAA